MHIAHTAHTISNICDDFHVLVTYNSYKNYSYGICDIMKYLMVKLLLECDILEWGIPIRNLREITNLRFCPTTVYYVMLFACLQCA